MEIAKRLNAIIAQLLPFLSQEVNMTTDLFWILCKHAPLASVTCKLSFGDGALGYIYVFFSTSSKLSPRWRGPSKSQ